jgi:hypothetical protein
VIVSVSWLESPHNVVNYRRKSPGLVLAADDKIWGVKAPSENSNFGFTLPMAGVPDPRFDRDFNGGLAIRVQMLVVYAWRQGLLNQVRFFGAVHDYRQNIMIGVGYSTVNVTPCFEHTPTSLVRCLKSDFEMSLDDLIGPEYQPPPKQTRAQRPWVI